MSHYQTLDLPFGADLAAIKAAYKVLVKKWHPDLNRNDPAAAARFVEINAAYEALIKEKSAPPPKFKPLNMNSGGRSDTKARFTVRRDVYLSVPEMLNGTHMTFDDTNGFCKVCEGSGRIAIDHRVDCLTCKGRGFSYREKGLISVQISCATCDGSGKCSFMPCEACGGFGSVHTDAASFAVPAGTLPGSIVTIPNGASDPSSGRHGDLDLIVHVKDAIYQVVDFDIETTILVDVWDISLGAKVLVTRPNGARISLIIPPRTEPGRRYTLQGGGFPGVNGVPGDFIVIVGMKPLRIENPNIKKALLKLKEISLAS